MIKGDHASFESAFIRRTLVESSVRIDGRGIRDFRGASISCARSEMRSTSKVQIGSTLVLATVSGEIVAPFADRPIDGILQFNADVSAYAENLGYTHQELGRILERSIKESESIDTESLCVISGEKVWAIYVDVKVLDASGGNIVDCCTLATMSALRAFRKPETSVVVISPASGNTPAITNVIVHHSYDREPLPLALHHTPLAVTIAVFRSTPDVSKTEKKRGGDVLLMHDPCAEEEIAMDGRICFFFNAHKELCSMTKLGGCSLPVDILLKATKLAGHRAEVLHEKLAIALAEVEEECIAERDAQLDNLRTYNAQKFNTGGASSSVASAAAAAAAAALASTKGGIDRNDPILQWDNTHKAAVLDDYI